MVIVCSAPAESPNGVAVSVTVSPPKKPPKLCTSCTRNRVVSVISVPPNHIWAGRAGRVAGAAEALFFRLRRRSGRRAARAVAALALLGSAKEAPTALADRWDRLCRLSHGEYTRGQR